MTSMVGTQTSCLIHPVSGAGGGGSSSCVLFLCIPFMALLFHEHSPFAALPIGVRRHSRQTFPCHRDGLMLLLVVVLLCSLSLPSNLYANNTVERGCGRSFVEMLIRRHHASLVRTVLAR
ncbi:hypothetical protein Pmar_PMAR000725 [Perkinsus marinus ATCC 50983]|uniref:Uncharacterized protein n=1 Tax=Perkinsus marinus (strain ATCC 50983 / TXsc) TaxID=423536 RepID=C5KXG6_PERM5|nr:hypothetical protein Pmar_PMAR000725 [Perkinsus marinus ATCC 50983]EER10690.1 hypothetical protein Pmar_PMAR000725 [Perkinsus marinus ATCC 50983]|eukprot:XP_002778895.1 hypothetical protein Pmar_PMAR000725 [Perkinsus marinus ATCC 50983]